MAWPALDSATTPTANAQAPAQCVSVNLVTDFSMQTSPAKVLRCVISVLCHGGVFWSHDFLLQLMLERSVRTFLIAILETANV